MDGRHTGRVEETRNLKGKGLCREERRVWTITYYRETLGEGKAKKKIQCTNEELLPLLVIRDGTRPILAQKIGRTETAMEIQRVMMKMNSMMARITTEMEITAETQMQMTVNLRKSELDNSKLLGLQF